MYCKVLLVINHKLNKFLCQILWFVSFFVKSTVVDSERGRNSRYSKPYSQTHYSYTQNITLAIFLCPREKHFTQLGGLGK